jgi:hypothetical protein
MATITYTATHPATGEVVTRTSGTMAYTHANLDRGTWHKSEAAARKAGGTVVPAVPTSVRGTASVGDFTGHPNAEAIDALISAKAAPKAKAKAVAAPQRPAKSDEDRKAARRARRLARRAAESPEAKAERLAKRRDRRAARKAAAVAK